MIVMITTFSMLHLVIKILKKYILACCTCYCCNATEHYATDHYDATEHYDD